MHLTQGLFTRANGQMWWTALIPQCSVHTFMGSKYVFFLHDPAYALHCMTAKKKKKHLFGPWLNVAFTKIFYCSIIKYSFNCSSISSYCWDPAHRIGCGTLRVTEVYNFRKWFWYRIEEEINDCTVHLLKP